LSCTGGVRVDSRYVAVKLGRRVRKRRRDVGGGQARHGRRDVLVARLDHELSEERSADQPLVESTTTDGAQQPQQLQPHSASHAASTGNRTTPNNH